MNLLRSSFRSWWQIPRKIGEGEEERRVTFLELFYDLVYVVLIAEFAHTLAEHINQTGVIGFIFMFVIVWVAWLNGVFYHDLHGNNDIRTRIFTFLQMFTVATMTVFAHNALGEGSVGFALSFATYQLILTFLWWRTGIHDPHHRPLSGPYTFSYLISIIIFISSIFVPIPWRFYMWAVGLFLSLIMPLYTTTLGKDNPEIQAQLDMVANLKPSAVERFGLLTIIVLGEIIVGVIRGVAGHHHLTWSIGLTALLGMLIAIGLWWIYFDFVAEHLPITGRITTYKWIYLHLPMNIGIVATGAAVFNVVEHTETTLGPEVRWLLVSAIAITLVSITLLMSTIQIPAELRDFYHTGRWVTVTSGILILLLGFTSLHVIPLLIILILLLLTPVLYGVMVWIKLLNAREQNLT